MKKSAYGFTLIELMIVVAVIGILAGIAYPSYTDYVIKSRRSDAKSAILNMQLAQEKWRANNISYTTSLSQLNVSNSSPDGHYELDIPMGTGNFYVVRARPASGGLQVGDTTCPSFTSNQNNEHAGPDEDISTSSDNDSGVTTSDPLGNCW